MSVKLCECGCGQPAPIAKVTRKKLGYIKGQPIRFIKYHHLQIRKNNNSYKKTLKPNHPRVNVDGYIYEHTFVAEKALGKYLPENAVVHHVNGNTIDNRKENLIICQDNAYYKFLHQRQRAYKACGHAHWRKCRFCKKYDDPENLHINGNNIHHRECDNQYRRKQRIKHKSKRQA